MTNFTNLFPKLRSYFSAVLLSPLFFGCADQAVEPAADMRKSASAEIVDNSSAANQNIADSTVIRTLNYQIDALTVGGAGSGISPFTGQLILRAKFDRQGNFITIQGFRLRLDATSRQDVQLGTATKFTLSDGGNRFNVTFRFFGSNNPSTIVFDVRGNVNTGYTGHFVTFSPNTPVAPSGTLTLTPIQ